MLGSNHVPHFWSTETRSGKDATSSGTRCMQSPSFRRPRPTSLCSPMARQTRCWKRGAGFCTRLIKPIRNALSMGPRHFPVTQGRLDQPAPLKQRYERGKLHLFLEFGVSKSLTHCVSARRSEISELRHVHGNEFFGRYFRADCIPGTALL